MPNMTARRAIAGKKLGAKVAIGGETGLDKLKFVAEKTGGVIWSGIKGISSFTGKILKELKQYRMVNTYVVRMLDFQEQLSFSMESGCKMNQVALEVMMIDLRRINRELDLGMEKYIGVISYENFNGSELKFKNYQKLSMESIGSFISKVFDKIKEFFSKIWNTIKDGFKKTFDVIGYIDEKVDAYRTAIEGIDSEPSKDEFKATKRILNLIPNTEDYTMENIAKQYDIQVKATRTTDTFTRRVKNDINKFENTFRSDTSSALAGIGESLKDLTYFRFGENKEPLADLVYYHVTIEKSGEKDGRLIFDEEKSNLIPKKGASCKPLTIDEISQVLDIIEKMKKSANTAYDVYHELEGEVKNSIKTSMKQRKQVQDKKEAKEMKAYLDLYNGIYALCPAISYLIVSTNIYFIEGCLSYIDESVKCY